MIKENDRIIVSLVGKFQVHDLRFQEIFPLGNFIHATYFGNILDRITLTSQSLVIQYKIRHFPKILVLFKKDTPA